MHKRVLRANSTPLIACQIGTKSARHQSITHHLLWWYYLGLDSYWDSWFALSAGGQFLLARDTCWSKALETLSLQNVSDPKLINWRRKEREKKEKNSLLTVFWNAIWTCCSTQTGILTVCILETLHTKKAHTHVCYSVIRSTYLSSALVKIILSRGGFAFKEHIGRSSGYIKTLLVAKIHATCFGKHGKSLAVNR